MFAKRISMSLLAMGLISLVVSAATFALFTAQTTNSDNVFSSGTVTLAGLYGCDNTINNIAPGDSGDFDCAVTYTGSLPAWLGLTTTFTGALMSCDGANSLLTQIDGGAYGVNSANQVVGAAPVNNGTSTIFHINWMLPLAAGNSCQGDSATLSLQVQAVQSANNTLAAPAVGPISWN